MRRAPAIPAHRIVVSKLLGAPYSSHTLYLGDQVIYSCLSPMSDDEIEQRIRAHLAPPKVPPAREIIYRPGRPKKTQGGNSTAWRTTPEDE